MNEKSLKVLEYYKIIKLLNDNIKSELGKRVLDELKPQTNIEDVKQMLKETSEAQSILYKRGYVPFDGICDIKIYLKKAKIGSCLDPKGLLRVKDNLRGARVLRNFIRSKEENEPFYETIEGLSESLNVYRDIEEQIEECIISENEISDNASTKLKQIRRGIANKKDSIKNKLNSIINSSSNEKMLQDAIVTIRQDRFVVPIKSEYKSNFKGIIHDQSASGATLFVEPMSIVNMNNELRQLKVDEKEEIERILMELTLIIGEVSDYIMSNLSVLAKLDFIFAKGKLSINLKALEPEILEEKIMYIKNARHPLIPKDEVVSNDFYIGENFSTLVITGPNTGGKTVTLKTIGLFSLMVQSGLHIPCDYGSKICVFDNIFADIGDEQSIEQSLSTFSSHMTNIVDIMNNFTKDSLVLFDELGAGTDPVEGAALAMSILDNLYTFKTMTIATTHYSELKNYALSKSGVENASVEFDVNTLSPTYRLMIGVPGKSNAFEISRKIGLSDFVINKAKEFIDSENIAFEDLMIDIERKRIKAKENEELSLELKKEAQELKEKYLIKKEKIESKKEKMVQKAKEEALEIVKEAKEKSEELIKMLRKLESEKSSKDKNKKIEDIRKEITKSIEGLSDNAKDILIPKNREKKLEQLKKGDYVRVITLNQEGIVLSCDDNKKKAVVQIGIMKMNLPYASLEKIKRKKEDNITKTTANIIKKKTKITKMEVDLRGLNIEEARIELDKYLDDACISNLENVTIIHGVGTGALKKGVLEILRTHKHVKEFRGGSYGEGGIGVTIVTIK